MKGNITLNTKELRRGQILELVKKQEMSLMQAATVLRLSYRQAKRLKARYLLKDLAGLAHGNRNRVSHRLLPDSFRQQILDLHQKKYNLFNDSHFTELLQERENISVSRETVRHILRAAAVPPKRRRRPPQHRSRRPRKPQIGMMVQCDGSPHPWFGPGHPPCSLMNAVDDAGSKILAAFFAPSESATAYLRLIDLILLKHGIPLSLYHDRHSSLVRNDEYWSLEEQMQGAQFPTHVGRVLQELGIQSIPAFSAQAKGRVERSFGVLQDRLVAELALEGISDIPTANAWLEKIFIPRYNRRFAKSPTEPSSVFKPISSAERFHKIAFAYAATVGLDNCVRLGGISIDIPKSRVRSSFARKKVSVRQHLDGSWSVWDGQIKVASHPATEFQEPIRSWRPKSGHDQTGAKQILQVYISSKPLPLPRKYSVLPNTIAKKEPVPA
jgi:transposase